MALDTIVGTWQNPDSTPVANGYLLLTLSQSATVIGTSQIAPTSVNIKLDATGSIPASTTIYGNDQLSPAGTVYYARVTNAAQQNVWSQTLSISGGSPININNLVPTNASPVLIGAVLLNPTVAQTITGFPLILTTSAPLEFQANSGATTYFTFAGTPTAVRTLTFDDATYTIHNPATPGVIGGTTPAAGTFTTLTANTSLVVNGSQAFTGVSGTTGLKLLSGTGTYTSGHGTKIDASGNVIDAGYAAASYGAAIQIDLTAQGADVSSTPIITPAANGMYRFSCWAVVSRAATSSSTLPACVVSFTDNDSGQTNNISTTNVNTGNALGTYGAEIEFPVFYAKSGAQILYSTSGYATSGATSMQFALHARLEGPF